MKRRRQHAGEGEWIKEASEEGSIWGQPDCTAKTGKEMWVRDCESWSCETAEAQRPCRDPFCTELRLRLLPCAQDEPGTVCCALDTLPSPTIFGINTMTSILQRRKLRLGEIKWLFKNTGLETNPRCEPRQSWLQGQASNQYENFFWA